MILAYFDKHNKEWHSTQPQHWTPTIPTRGGGPLCLENQLHHRTLEVPHPQPYSRTPDQLFVDLDAETICRRIIERCDGDAADEVVWWFPIELFDKMKACALEMLHKKETAATATLEEMKLTYELFTYVFEP